MSLYHSFWYLLLRLMMLTTLYVFMMSFPGYTRPVSNFASPESTSQIRACSIFVFSLSWVHIYSFLQCTPQFQKLLLGNITCKTGSLHPPTGRLVTGSLAVRTHVKIQVNNSIPAYSHIGGGRLVPLKGVEDSREGGG